MPSGAVLSVAECNGGHKKGTFRAYARWVLRQHALSTDSSRGEVGFVSANGASYVPGA